MIASASELILLALAARYFWIAHVDPYATFETHYRGLAGVVSSQPLGAFWLFLALVFPVFAWLYGRAESEAQRTSHRRPPGR